MFLLLAALKTTCVTAADTRPALVRQFEEWSRGWDASTAGWIDLLHAQTLTPSTDIERDWGRPEGFMQARRKTFVLAHPARARGVRGGFAVASETGGWTGSPWMFAPGSPSRVGGHVLGGVLVSSPRTDAFAMAGAGRMDAIRWKGPGPSIDKAPEGLGWGILGMGRGLIGAAASPRGDLLWKRAALRPAMRRPEFSHASLIRRVGAGVSWSRADLRLHPGNGWTVDLEAPVWKDKVRVLSAAGFGGPVRVLLEADIDDLGFSGLDLGAIQTRSDGWVPVARFRMPLLTFGINDPDSRAALSSGDLVWSCRWVMAWDDARLFRSPGRRADPLRPPSRRPRP